MTKAQLGMLALPVLASAMLVLAAPVAVRADPAEEYGGYHRMVHAAAACAYPGIDIRDNADDATSEDKMVADHAQMAIAAKIEERLGADLSAGDKLFLIETARDDVDAMIMKNGCDDNEDVALVHAYDQQLGVTP